MINPNNPRHLQNLSIGLERSRYLLQPFRENRLRMMKAMAGAHYSWTGSPQRQPLNLLKQYYDIVGRLLAPQSPRALCNASQDQLKPLAANFMAWSDKASQEIGLDHFLRICVGNALLSLGIMKVGEAYAHEMDFFGTKVAVGQPFAEPVDLDDWAHDMTAKRYDQVQYSANRYRVPLEEAKENKFYDKTEREKLKPQTRFAYNERGDERSTVLSQSTMQLWDVEVQDHVELWDVWLPKEKKVLVMPYQESVEGGFGSPKPLHIIDWKGPPEGPFILLSYSDLPNNIMPMAPLQALKDLHDLVNILWRKLGRQAERQKSLLAFMGTASDDAERITRAEDGDAVRVDFPERAKAMEWGGMNQMNIAAVMQAKNFFDEMAGNLAAMGGLGPQSPTLGQDEMIQQQSSQQMAEMKNRTTIFAKKVLTHLGHWWWTNPFLTYTANRQVEGIDIPVQITPQQRQVPFEQLGFDIDVYSMAASTPQGRAAKIKANLQLILPLLPQMMQQGVQIKWPQLMQLLAKYDDLPELMDILEIGPPPQAQGPMTMGHQATKAPITSRTNIRQSKPTMTDRGHSMMMQQALMGAGGMNNGRQQ